MKKRTVVDKSVAVAVLALAIGLNVGVARAAEPDVSTWMYMKGDDWWQVGSSYTRANWLDPENPSAEAVTIADSTKKLFYANRPISTPNASSVTFPGTTLAIGSAGNLSFDYQVQIIDDLRLFGGSTVTMTAYMDHRGNVTVYGDADRPVRYNTGTYLHRYVYLSAKFTSDTPSAVINLGNDNESKTRDYFKGGGWGERVVVSGSWSGYYGTLNMTKGTYYQLYPGFTGLPGKMKFCGNAFVALGNITMTLGELELDDGSVWLLDGVDNTAHCIVTKKLTINGNPLIYKTNVTTDGYIDIIRLTGDAAKAENLPDVLDLQLDPQSPLHLKIKDFNPHFILADGTDGEKIVRLTWDALKYLMSDNGGGYSAFDANVANSWWTPTGVPTADDHGIYLMHDMFIRLWGTISYPDTTVVCHNQSIFRNATDMYFKKIVFVGDNNKLCSVKNYGPDNSNLHAPLELRDATVGFSGWASTWGRNTGPISGTGTFNLSCSGSSYGQTVEGDNSGYAGVFVCSDTSATDAALTSAARPSFYLKFGHTNALGGAYAGSTAVWKATTFKNSWSRFISDVTISELTRGVYFGDKNALEVDEGFAFTIGSDATYNGKVYKRGAGALVLAGAAPHFVSGDEQVTTPTTDLNVLKVAAGSLKVAGTNAVNGLAVTFAEGATWIVDACATGDLKAFGAINTAWDAPFASEAANGKITLDVDVGGVAKTAGAFDVAICTVNKKAPGLAFDFPARKGRHLFEVTTRDNGDSLTYVMNVSGTGLMVIVR